MRAIHIPAALLERIYAHAREAFPDECCGYLVGTAESAESIVPCRNAQDDGELDPSRGADRGFVIAGRELFDFAKSFDGERPARVVYHSHTNGRAYFSDTDRTMARSAAYPVQHLVVGVTADGVTEAAQFALDSGDFLEIARWKP
jgi:proteasome lid subunit RPN8/RPN11